MRDPSKERSIPRGGEHAARQGAGMPGAGSIEEAWPSLPYAEWNDTYVTLHMWTQVVGKIRLALSPMVNHWWHVTLYVTPSGLTTSAIPYGARTFEILFDFIDHNLTVHTSDGATRYVNIPHAVHAAACASTRTSRAGHDWLVDCQPTSITYSNTGMVLGRDIAGRIEVSMQFIATGTTHKTAPGTAVVAGGLPTATTSLRGMSRIDRNHRTTPFLGFVLHKGFQLGERPRMHAAAGFGFALDRCTLPNVGQVFQHNHCARFDRCRDLFGEDVIVVATKAGLFSAYPLQVPLGRLRALPSRAPRFYALNTCAIQQAHTRGNLTSTVCCFGKPCLNTRLQLLCVLVSDREPHGVVPPSSGRTVLQVPMGQADCAKTRSQSVDRSSLHTFGAVWIKPHFLQTTYAAGADLAGWDRSSLERQGS
jgi:Family of unknown function (DUF5996)